MPLRKAHDPWLLGTTILLALVGVLVVGSSSSYLALRFWNAPSVMFWKQAGHLALAAGVFLFALRIRYRGLAERRVLFPMFVCCIALLVVVLFMPSAGGARRWIVLGPVRFQPSEIAKLFVVIYAAGFMARKADRVNDLHCVLYPALAVVGSLAALIVVEPDFSSAVILVALLMLVLFVAGLRFRYLVGLGGIGLVGGIAAVILEPYRLKRIIDFVLMFFGLKEPDYQLLQSWIALGNGGVTGVGLGQGRQQAFFLPAAHTDFIYSILGEELGLVGTVGVLVCFVVILWRGLRTAVKTAEPFGAYLALGITCWLVFQALAHMLVCVGWLPTTGLTLPFISYGGSSLVISSAAMGLLLNISQDCNLHPSSPRRKGDIPI